MGSDSNQTEPPKDPATTDDIQAAIKALSPVERFKLERFASYRIKGVGLIKGKGKTGIDVIQDACLSALEGRRIWDKSAVSFYGFLVGTIRSMTSHLAEAKRSMEPIPESMLGPEQPKGAGILEGADPKSPIPSEEAIQAERAVAAGKFLDELLTVFQEANDEIAYYVLAELSKNNSRAEICETLGIPAKEYDVALKRIHWAANSLLKSGDFPYVG